MLKRRQFLGSMAAASVVAASAVVHGSTPKPFDITSDTAADLKWRCDTIQTVGQAPRNRAPVVTGISLDGNGNQLAVVGDDHFVSIYNFEDRRFTHFLAEHEDWVRAAQFQPNGSQFTSVGNDRRILVWDSSSWSRPTELARHPAAIINAAYSPDGTKLATVGFEQTARIYDIQSQVLERPLECACDDNHAVAFSADSKRVAIGGRCGTIRVWDVASADMIAEYKAHRQRVRSVRFIADGHVISCSDDQSIRIVHPDRTDLVESMPRESAKQFDILMLDSETFASARSDNRIAIWNLARKEQIGILQGHTGTVTCLAADSNRLVSGSYDTQVRVWHRQVHAGFPQPRQTQANDGWNQKLK